MHDQFPCISMSSMRQSGPQENDASQQHDAFNGPPTQEQKMADAVSAQDSADKNGSSITDSIPQITSPRSQSPSRHTTLYSRLNRLFTRSQSVEDSSPGSSRSPPRPASVSPRKTTDLAPESSTARAIKNFLSNVGDNVRNLQRTISNADNAPRVPLSSSTNVVIEPPPLIRADAVQGNMQNSVLQPRDTGVVNSHGIHTKVVKNQNANESNSPITADSVSSVEVLAKSLRRPSRTTSNFALAAWENTNLHNIISSARALSATVAVTGGRSQANPRSQTSKISADEGSHRGRKTLFNLFRTATAPATSTALIAPNVAMSNTANVSQTSKGGDTKNDDHCIDDAKQLTSELTPVPVPEPPAWDAAVESSEEADTEYWVFTWGDNTFGQCLKPKEAQESNSNRLTTSRETLDAKTAENSAATTNATSFMSKPERLPKFQRQRIVCLTCGVNSTCAISEEGDVWGGGGNFDRQIHPSVDDDLIAAPLRIEDFEDKRLHSMAQGESHTIVVLDSGIALGFGTNEFGELGCGPQEISLKPLLPRRVLGTTVKLAVVACGEHHTLAADVTGRIYSTGCGTGGCLGLGPDICEASVLTPIPTLEGIPIQQIAAAASHSMALTISGEVFVWGKNRRGCLGVSSETTSDLFVPTLLSDNDVPLIKSIATGPKHSSLIGSGNVVLMAGENQYGALGLDPAKFIVASTFTKVVFPPNVAIRMIACGENHTVFIDTQGLLWSCGKNTEGQLGRVTKTSIAWKPTKVPLGAKILFYTVACGRDHTAAAAIRLPASETHFQRQILDKHILHRLDSQSVPLRPTPPIDVYQIRSDTRQSRGSPTEIPSAAVADASDSSSGGLNAKNVGDSIEESSVNQNVASNVSLSLDKILNAALPNTSQRVNLLYRALSVEDPTKLLNSGRAVLSALEREEYVSHIKTLAQEKHQQVRENAKVPESSLTDPAGCSVDELVTLLFLLNATDAPDKVSNAVYGAERRVLFEKLRSRLHEVFSDVNRLNSSFLLPGRLLVIDVEGIESVFELIEVLDPSEKSAIYTTILKAAQEAADKGSTISQNFFCEDQLRWIPILMQCRYETGASTYGQIRDLFVTLSNVVFTTPPSGRLALTQIFQHQYPSNIFGNRLVAHMKLFLNGVITAVPKGRIYESPVIWKGILLYQVLYLASILWAAELRQRSLDLASRNAVEGKVAQSEFTLISIENKADLPKEISSVRKYFPSPPDDNVPSENPRLVENRTVLFMRPDGPAIMPAAALPTGLVGHGASVASYAAETNAEEFGTRNRSNSGARTVTTIERDALTDFAAATGEGTGEANVATNVTAQTDNVVGPTEGATPSVAGTATGPAPETVQTSTTNKRDLSDATLSKTSPSENQRNKRRKLMVAEADMDMFLFEKLGRPGGTFSPIDAIDVSTLNPAWNFFLAHQNLCPLAFKRNVIMFEATAKQEESLLESLILHDRPFFIISVRRSHVVEDALTQVLCSPINALLRPLKVNFRGEEGVDAGGLKREFFRILVMTLFDPQYGMFTYDETSRTVWFSRSTIDCNQEFFLVGVILGLALYNDILLDLRFPKVIYKKLQNLPVGVEDLEDVFPAQGNSFLQVLQWPATDADGFNSSFGHLTFEVEWDFFGELRTHELVENGKDKQLSYDNREEYVAAYVKYLLTTSIEAQFESFKRGYLRFQTSLLRTLSPAELQLLVCGSPNLDFEELRAGAVYEGYDSAEEYIQGFWNVMTSFDLEQRKKLLRFCTGTDRVPVGGLRELKLKVHKNGAEPTNKLPTAYTCFNLLLLPRYSDAAKLRERLITAIENSQGFGLQ